MACKGYTERRRIIKQAAQQGTWQAAKTAAKGVTRSLRDDIARSLNLRKNGVTK